MPGSFFDSNILLYSASSDDDKADRAEALIVRGGTVSAQVLNEVANVARRKMHLTWVETRDLLLPFRKLLTITPVTEAIHNHGLRLAERHGFAIYDSMIVAAAIAAHCDTLWSEDMHHDLTVESVLTIRNPFA
ncbi:ribonuclease VapC [Polymorphobacter glacialis]|uniref:Ribonuclease VapC n=1 Tax=Sandarakinorhabdus glacialis TaxID=1614636 RepID=A0A917E3L8_9SPHN|nr:PIN domain-containing protein [Polymorphobacter glacialis]GGE01649.1 ribonuclease VapC [Polymorphobacter glacialis]